MKRYEGKRIHGLTDVRVDGVPLNPRLDLWKHSVTGFEWGYTGSGPAQLALAILADLLEDDERALNLYQRFKWEVIVGLPRKRWTFTSEQIEEAVRRLIASESMPAGSLSGYSQAEKGNL
jgi:hypothetical protein